VGRDRIGRRGGSAAAIAIAALAVAAPARAATYAVGPGRALPGLDAIARELRPGDVVEIDGDATYPGDLVLRNDGAPDAKITIRGRPRNGRPPRIAGGRTTLEVRGSHYVIEGLEITGGSERCVFHHADDVTIRDSVIHDCRRHGILGADEDSGSLSLEGVEIYRSGDGDGAHQIYVATDETAHPGSVFRMERSFVHDALGGNNVKSRAERNEIYSNWIEGALYHEIELIGPDGDHRAREDSDVVGNVIHKTHAGYAVRVGGDGTGETNGRYRFVNNTIVLCPEARAVFRLFNGLESIEMSNNALVREGGGGLTVVREQEVRWAAGRPLVAGTNNWIPRRSTGVPREWQATIEGDDPGFVGPGDPRPSAASPLVDAGAAALPSPPSCAFPRPLAEPSASPPLPRLAHFTPYVAAIPRRRLGAIDIGAFEYGAAPPSAPSAQATPEPPPPAIPRPQPPVNAPPPRARGGCGCRSSWARADGLSGASIAAWAIALLGRRRARGRQRR
jgi:hypothetical protein